MPNLPDIVFEELGRDNQELLADKDYLIKDKKSENLQQKNKIVSTKIVSIKI